MKKKLKCLSQKYQSVLTFKFVHNGNGSNYCGIFQCD